ncbi:MAG TPA: hypothetical protein DEB17_00615 [Chlorobaculum sp.]|uniref:Uncharacterized protein n=1 Tax=Chlorobaculum tepidum (strain ATCC 49652 / DSM 12025 / NBRC 103806 / TLS) TaxID=194439 RepID=Q8KBY4_CHLTE|nr:hypothetical protein CT1648 [Chlorobaculum tepidum TLS]HBU22502.1 hypothetical protein [Chlorobaculum sp.]
MTISNAQKRNRMKALPILKGNKFIVYYLTL